MTPAEQTLWETIQLASEIELKGFEPLSSNDAEILKLYPDLHLLALKKKKQNIEYQFSSHRLIMLKYYQDYRNKITTLEEYEDLRVEQIAWKTKAASFLARVEQKIIELKVRGANNENC